MNRIEALIEQLCPEGVEWKTLGEVAFYPKNRISSNLVSETNYVGVDNLLQNKQGKTVSSYVPTTGTLIEFKENDVLIGNIRPYLKKIWLSNLNGGTNGDVLVLRLNEFFQNYYHPKFLYYQLASDHFFDYDMQFAKGAKMPRGDKDAILRYPIPIPPLPIQNEIVKILDLFTQLEAELEAELEARKTQYAYYRDALLNFEGKEVEWKTLGELTDVVTGGEVPSSCIKGFIPSDKYQYPIYGNGLEVYGYTDKYRIDKDSVTISSIGANTGSIYYRKAFFTPIVRLKVLLPKTDNLLSKYLYYYLSSIKINSKKSSVPNMNADDVKKIKVPIPSISQQENIINILDKFDALVNDLSSGLPAEIKARRQQYEYYRNKLLTFKNRDHG
jgi:type I restriction enzyme S subunit